MTFTRLMTFMRFMMFMRPMRKVTLPMCHIRLMTFTWPMKKSDLTVEICATYDVYATDLKSEILSMYHMRLMTIMRLITFTQLIGQSDFTDVMYATHNLVVTDKEKWVYRCTLCDSCRLCNSLRLCDHRTKWLYNVQYEISLIIDGKPQYFFFQIFLLVWC